MIRTIVPSSVKNFEIHVGQLDETLSFRFSKIALYFESNDGKFALVTAMAEPVKCGQELITLLEDKHLSSVAAFKVIGPKGESDKWVKYLKERHITCVKQVVREGEFELFYTVLTGKIILSKGTESTLENKTTAEIKQKKVGVLVVDDSSTIIQLLSMIFKKDDNIEVVGACENPTEVEAMVKKLKPDVVTMDIHMPVMSGVDLVKKLVPLYQIPIVMISSMSQEDGPEVLNALEFGAVDYIQKPTLKELDHVSQQIIERVKNAAQVKLKTNIVFDSSKLKSAALLSSASGKKYDSKSIVLIGSSTGGTEALKNLFSTLPEKIPPIVVVQHIPAVFSMAFAKRLNEIFPFEVKEAQDGDVVAENKVLIAPGGKQLGFKRVGDHFKVVITDDEPMNRHKPSVDYMFKSAINAKMEKIVAVILTGMGADGAREMLELKKRGARTIAQNQDTCVVFGMPKEAIEKGATELVMPLLQIGPKIIDLTSESALTKTKSA